MTRGMILNAARRDTQGALVANAVLLAICLAVLGINWRYVYNFVTGPYEFTAELAGSPGAREFVRATGKVVPTGVVQETTLRLLRGLTESKSVSAQYLAMQAAGKVLLVKVDPAFSGQTVEGRLTPLPEAVRASLPPELPLHPWLIEATTGYRWDFNLFVMIAAPLVVLLLLLLPFTVMGATDVNRHAAFKRQKGDATAIAMKVEDELMRMGDRARAGSMFITNSWMVSVDPTLHLFAIADLMGVGHKETQGKSGAKHRLLVWARGQTLEDSIDSSEADATAVITRLAEKCPWVLVSDATAFDKRWRANRQQTESEVDARRKAAFASAKATADKPAS